jgi:hypothetical protein
MSGSDILNGASLSFPATDRAKFLATKLEPRSSAAAILIDEVDARFDQYSSDATQSFRIGPSKTSFEPIDSL